MLPPVVMETDDDCFADDAELDNGEEHEEVVGDGQDPQVSNLESQVECFWLDLACDSQSALAFSF